MERAEWEKQYREQCYLPVFREYIEKLMQEQAAHARETGRRLEGCVEAFLANLGFLQEKGKAGEIQTVCISFPYSMLACGEPCLLFEAYPGVPFLDDALVFREFAAPWLFPDWEQLLGQLYKETGKLGMNAVIRRPFIKSHALKSAEYILYLWAGLVKCHLHGIEEKEAYKNLKKADGFTISFGGYMDWQSPMWISRKETDIFFCEEGTDLRFCRFSGIWYEDKAFDALVLDDCRFQGCTFRNCSFAGVSFKDAAFRGCTFSDCRFSDVDLAGAGFDGCRLEDIQMEGVRTYFLQGVADSLPAAAGNADFTGCFLTRVDISGSDLSASSFRDCRMEAVAAGDCPVSDSFREALLSAEGGVEP